MKKKEDDDDDDDDDSKQVTRIITLYLADDAHSTTRQWSGHSDALSHAVPHPVARCH